MTRSQSFVLVFTLVASAAVLASCSGNNNNYNSAGLTCGARSGQVVLAYPAPGSTGIPDNFQGVIFASTGTGLTSGYQAYIVPAGSSTGELLNYVAAAPSPLPSPNAVPPFANPNYQESSNTGLGALPAATQISVYLNDGNSNCSPNDFLGSFTTQ
jgi:hypothetical protein